MNISIITVFEQLYEPFLSTSLVGRAQKKGAISINVRSFFSYVQPKERIDAPISGPGAGLLIKPVVVERAIEEREAAHGKAFKIFFSPKGEKVDQKMLHHIVQKAQEYNHVMFIPSRYEGMDTRVEQEYADLTLSVGDLVLMGGDIPTMMVLEGMLRLVPDVVGKQESVDQDSFTGPFVDYPSYTEPLEWRGKSVPELLLSGNHGVIDTWRKEKAAQETVMKHFSWLRSSIEKEEDKALARKFIPRHYLALMHGDVLVGKERIPGATSVTSIDIHDIARSSKTYGIEQFFIVTPLLDQQKIVKKLLEFWNGGVGADYNISRHNAIKAVEMCHNFDEVVSYIEKKEGKKPLVIATSARFTAAQQHLSYFDQSVVWQHERPVLLLFGTGQGLAQELVDRCDYLLLPVEGLYPFNHLSVRSAAAIILDRWLGINKKMV